VLNHRVPWGGLFIFFLSWLDARCGHRGRRPDCLILVLFFLQPLFDQEAATGRVDPVLIAEVLIGDRLIPEWL